VANKNVAVKSGSKKDMKMIFDFIQTELYHCRLKLTKKDMLLLKTSQTLLSILKFILLLEGRFDESNPYTD